MSGLSGWTAMAPIDSVLPSSKTGSKVMPPLVDLYKPDEAAPTYRMSGFPGTPATSATRPANIAGPIDRHDRPPSAIAGPEAGRGVPDEACGAAGEKLEAANTAIRPRNLMNRIGRV